jgi:hypothetical protein
VNQFSSSNFLVPGWRASGFTRPCKVWIHKSSRSLEHPRHDKRGLWKDSFHLSCWTWDDLGYALKDWSIHLRYGPKKGVPFESRSIIFIDYLIAMSYDSYEWVISAALTCSRGSSPSSLIRSSSTPLVGQSRRRGHVDKVDTADTVDKAVRQFEVLRIV